MSPAIRLLVNIGRVIAACIISFFFFVGISLLHAMIDVGPKNDEKADAKKQVLVEMVRKPPKEEKKATPKVRQVKQSANQSKNLGNRMSMKLVPDLSVDAGGGGGDAAVLQSQQLQAEVFEENETDERPIPMSVKPIPFPPEAIEQGVSGTLQVYFIIGYDGKVRSIDVVKSPASIITRVAKRTIASWRFKPARKKGVPVNVRVYKEVKFDLRK